jgi:hypothetical protein
VEPTATTEISATTWCSDVRSFRNASRVIERLAILKVQLHWQLS